MSGLREKRGSRRILFINGFTLFFAILPYRHACKDSSSVEAIPYFVRRISRLSHFTPDLLHVALFLLLRVHTVPFPMQNG